MRVYRHPTDANLVIAEVATANGSRSIEVARSSLPADVGQARTYLAGLLVAPPLPPGFPSPITMEADPTLDEQESVRPDYEAFIAMASAEIDALTAAIAGYDAMTTAQKLAVVKRLMQENLAIIRALRYIAARFA